MNLSIQNLLEKITRLKSVVQKQKQDIYTLKIDNLFLQQRIHKLKQAAREDHAKQNGGEHAKDFNFSSNENLSR